MCCLLVIRFDSRADRAIAQVIHPPPWSITWLARGVQRLIEIFIALVALACAVGGHGLPLNVLGSLAIGWGTTAVVRLVFGSPLGLPSAQDVRLLPPIWGWATLIWMRQREYL